MVVLSPAPGAVLFFYGNRLVCRFESVPAVIQGTPLFELFNAYLAKTPWGADGPVRLQFEGMTADVTKATLLAWIIQRMGEAAGHRERRKLGWYYPNTELGYLVPFNKPRTRKGGGSYRWHRHPRTMAEKRLNSLVVFEEGEPGPRASRKSNYLSSAWDDIGRRVERNWKSFRRTRWA